MNELAAMGAAALVVVALLCVAGVGLGTVLWIGW